MSNPFVQLTLVKLREYTREPEAMFWVFVFPVLMTCALGIAFSDSGAAAIRVGVLSPSTSLGAGPSTPLGASAGLVATLDADPRIDATALSPEQAAAQLRDGAIALVVVPGAGGAVGYRFDRTRPESSVARFTVDEVLQRASGRADAFTPADDLVALPGSRYIDWLVPGLLGMNVMMTGLWGIAFSIGMARTKKLIKRLSATPMRRSHFLGAQVAGRLVFLPIEAGVLIVFAHYVFGVPVRGSWLLLSGVVLLGAVSGAALSLFVASRARSFEAISGLINIAIVPMWILSGVFFSSSHFPAAIQPFVQALPLTALNDALRSVMLAGDGFGAIAHEVAILSAWTIVCFGLTLRIFRWQ
ncbi:MAG TPA: ABC transporter permease [Vicinamibacterales bacterium]|nr:ABC transporter permease [Vicinamibacterales bacterium]